MSEQQDNLNKQIKNTIEQINDYAEELVHINKQILKIESGGIENANDLRDRRNLIIDELAKMGRITYDEDMYVLLR